MSSLLLIFFQLGNSEIISHHCNGKIEEMILHQSPNGSANRFLFFEDGELEETIQEQNNLRHGICTRLWSNGNVMSQSTWEQGELIYGVMYSPSGALIGEIYCEKYAPLTASLKTRVMPLKIAGNECGLKLLDYVLFSAYIGPDGTLDFILIWRNPHIKDLDLAIYNTLAGVDFSADVPLDRSEGVVFTMMISIHLR